MMLKLDPHQFEDSPAIARVYEKLLPLREWLRLINHP
jgi:hypothetical protein